MKNYIQNNIYINCKVKYSTILLDINYIIFFQHTLNNRDCNYSLWS